MERSRKHLPVVAAVFITAVLTAGVPALANVYADNSDKVDGKHAVGSGASLAEAAGKLVATNKSGKFPARFIPKVAAAKNADRLGGETADAFGHRMTGVEGPIDAGTDAHLDWTVPGLGDFRWSCESGVAGSTVIPDEGQYVLISGDEGSHGEFASSDTNFANAAGLGTTSSDLQTYEFFGANHATVRIAYIAGEDMTPKTSQCLVKWVAEF